MEDRAIEIYTNDTSVYLNFAQTADRDKVHDHILSLVDCRSVEKTPIEGYTNKWICGLISNYEYLKILNRYAERSLMDLAHYPVFPWVLQDYTSQ